jgi:hypothetical protein
MPGWCLAALFGGKAASQAGVPGHGPGYGSRYVLTACAEDGWRSRSPGGVVAVAGKYVIRRGYPDLPGMLLGLSGNGRNGGGHAGSESGAGCNAHAHFFLLTGPGQIGRLLHSFFFSSRIRLLTVSGGLTPCQRLGDGLKVPEARVRQSRRRAN